MVGHAGELEIAALRFAIPSRSVVVEVVTLKCCAAYRPGAGHEGPRLVMERHGRWPCSITACSEYGPGRLGSQRAERRADACDVNA